MVFPVYNYSLLLSNIALMAAYAVYQPEEDSDGGGQVGQHTHAHTHTRASKYCF